MTTWTANRDGIGHAWEKGRGIRTLCGQVRTEQRYHWPIKMKCGVCLFRATADSR